MTAITRESLDRTEKWLNRAGLVTDEEVLDFISALRDVLQIHRPDPRHGGLLCEDDGQEWPCRTISALAGTQTDDGAVSTVAAEGVALGTAEPTPAPSSPDRPAPTRGLWASQGETIQVGTRYVTEADLRERIAADIEARRDLVTEKTDAGRNVRRGLSTAARIARGQS